MQLMMQELRRPLHDAQAQAMPFAYRVWRDPHLVELLEDVGQVLLGYADPGVVHIDPKPVLAVTLAADPHDAPWGVPNRVAHQIAQDLTEKGRIARSNLSRVRNLKQDTLLL